MLISCSPNFKDKKTSSIISTLIAAEFREPANIEVVIKQLKHKLYAPLKIETTVSALWNQYNTYTVKYLQEMSEHSISHKSKDIQQWKVIKRNIPRAIESKHSYRERNFIKCAIDAMNKIPHCASQFLLFNSWHSSFNWENPWRMILNREYELNIKDIIANKDEVQEAVKVFSRWCNKTLKSRSLKHIHTPFQDLDFF